MRGEFPAAEVWFRKMQDLASRWVCSIEPTDDLARDLLAASYRKLGDLKKFSKDYAGARNDYLTAIALGRQVLADDPGSFTFKSHLGARARRSGRRRPRSGRSRRGEGALPARPVSLAPSWSRRTPRSSRTRFRFLHTQFKLAQLEEDELRSLRGRPQLFRRILDRVNPLKSEGRQDRPDELSTNARALTTEIAYCEAAPASTRRL